MTARERRVRQTGPWVDRFWPNVVKSGECLLWTGSVRGKGYGSMSVDGHTMAAHHAALLLVGITVPKGMTVDHLCRNRLCVNHKHLEVVTNRENVLRGVGLCAVNARKQTCKRGHPYDAIRQHKTGERTSRHCRVCKRMDKAEKRASDLAAPVALARLK